MRKVTAFLLVLVFLLPATLSARNATHAALLKSTVYPLQWMTQVDDDGTMELATHCSIFSVNPEHHGWMTARHCVEDTETGVPNTDAFFIDGHPVRLVEVDTDHDLALMQTTDWGVKVGLKLARQAPQLGDTVENLGYSWGAPHPFYFAGYVASIDYEDYIFAGMTAIGGQSGSPVVDSEGRVVGVTHVRLGGGFFTDFSPLLGFTPYAVLKVYDRGWVFSR